MDLKKLLIPQKKSPEQEHFLALEIHESLIKTAVWKIEEGKPLIISLGSFELWDSEESLVNGVDASLTFATKDLTKKPIKVILGLPEPWLEDDKIHPTKTSLIKRLLTELGLKPIGLVTSTQAIIHHLKKKEGVPPSAVLLEVYPDKVTVAVVKLGKVKAIEEVGRSGELSKDVQEGLVRLSLEQLPPRFILTNGSNLENEQQQLLSYPWQEKLPFLHLPKVEVLPAEFSIEAIALAGGLEAASNLGIVDEEVADSEPSPATQPTSNLSKFGFRIEQPEETQEMEEPQEVEESKELEEAREVEDSQEPEELAETDKAKSPPPPPLKPSIVKTYSNRFKHTLGFFKDKLKNNRKKSILATATVLLLIPIFLATAYLMFATAQITIAVKETPLVKSIDVYFGEEAVADGISLPVNIQSLTASVTESIPTTGEALVGEKASGTVTLYNRTNDSITIKSGTKIESDNLIFLINTTTTVASKSANIVEGTEEFGKSTDVPITAAGIGTRYNLPKKTQFSVGNYSRTVIYAVAENDLTGGSSRTVKAVSEDDQQKLFEMASQKVVSEINSKVKAQDPGLSSLVVGELSYPKKDFSKEVGEEADVLKLDLTGEVKVLLYSNSEVINQLSTKLVPKTNPGMKLLADQTNIEILSPEELDSNTYQTQANIKGLLIPVIDQDRYISQLKGKHVKKLTNILETIPGYKSTKIVIKPNIPFLSSYIPLNKKRVTLNITTSK